MTADPKTYLGKRGYCIYKDKISISEQGTIRDDLMVAPYIPKSPAPPIKFPIYRESMYKLYVPRFYGKSVYGEPEAIKLDEPEKSNMKFIGELRPYQNNIVSSYHKNLEKGGGLLEVPCGRGKTICALKIASDVGLKTLVIVHKGFLLNQWVERIEQFIPNAKIGKIQGKTIDIEGKDIVIGMLQSLSMKEYPEETFSSFGLTIVDEVHHIAAEVFVRSLFKIVTKYVLGLSATMNRKDGLSKVFKMFLGDIVYKETREGNDNVLVKAITYKTTDDEFNEVKYDYRGNPAYSTMISKLCNFNPRSEFILKVVQDIYNENTKQQIMILAHNKSLLKYFYDAIDHRKFASVGYYVGGMKEQALKESENKSIIIGTYAMASEALDIKTLTTLVMATPKTDITQAVGRILRTKEHTPLVVDIIDDHDVFTNQWKKRKSYYKKENYKIISCDSNNYNNTDYKTEFDPENAPKKGSAKKQRKCLIKL
tara:strand:- start:166 stop:1608 length:1443 start_codon:yes stop_codon:yes gene_type:complete